MPPATMVVFSAKHTFSSSYPERNISKKNIRLIQKYRNLQDKNSIYGVQQDSKTKKFEVISEKRKALGFGTHIVREPTREENKLFNEIERKKVWGKL